MSELREHIDELVRLMDDYGLEKARLKGEDWSIEFSSQVESKHIVQTIGETVAQDPKPSAQSPKPAPNEKAAGPAGVPVTSPMMGIFYTSSNPGSPPFVSVGDAVIAGQVVGLIEAMKVFNEITAPTSGTVKHLAAENGQLVSPGEPLVYIG